MGRTRINPTVIDWDNIASGTIVSGGYLGLDSSDEVVKANAGGGGSTAADDVTAGDAAVTISTSTGNITLDTPADIILSADGGNITMDDGTTTVFDFDTDNVIFKMMDDADTGDYMSFTVGSAGSTVGATNDDDGYAANLTFDVDGVIYLDSYLYGTITLREGAQEYLRFQRASTGTDHAEIQNMENAMDLIFKQYDGTETLRLTDDGDVKVAADIYVDKIRRASDSGTTTKILLNDEAIKLYAGHSVNNICTIDSTGLKIDNGSLETATIDYTDGDLAMTIADGGKVTFSSGFSVGSDAAGDMLYHNGTSYVRLAKGTADQVLTMNDAANAPNWEDASGGGSDTFVLTDRGKMTSSPSTSYVYHRAALNGADWTSTDSVTSYPTFQYGLYSYHLNYVVWQVPVNCTLDSYRVKGLRKGGSGGYTDNTITMTIYKMSTTVYNTIYSDYNNGDPGVTKIEDIEIAANNDMPFDISGTLSSGNTVSAGESLYYTIKATSAYSNSDHYWTISLKMTPT